MNLVLAVAAGVFTWLVLELLGVELAVTMGVIVGFLDLVPLIGFTVGGLLVAIVAAFHDFPGALIAWLAFFLVYQQVQDRVLQPLCTRTRSVSIRRSRSWRSWSVASWRASWARCSAIPVAASIGVLIDEAL